MRLLLALLAGAGAAALGAAILGEYPDHLDSPTALLAGALLGVALGEVVVAIGHHGGLPVAAAAAAFSAGGLAWAGWIASGRGLVPFPAWVWPGAAVAAVAAGAWVRRAGRAPGSSEGP